MVKTTTQLSIAVQLLIAIITTRSIALSSLHSSGFFYLLVSMDSQKIKTSAHSFILFSPSAATFWTSSPCWASSSTPLSPHSPPRYPLLTTSFPPPHYYTLNLRLHFHSPYSPPAHYSPTSSTRT